MDLIGTLSPKVPVTMLVGTVDDVAPPALSEAYRDAAQKAGKPVKLIELPGKGHGIFEETAVTEQLALLAKE